ncbi:hypothetical protein NQL31_000616 [Lotmaria passim]
MAASLESLTHIITETPESEASFYSLAYVAALQQCTAWAYQATLTAVTRSTRSSGVCGDSLTECVTRLRVETERRVASQLRTSLLQEQAAAVRAWKRDGRAYTNIEADVVATPRDNGGAAGAAAAAAAVAAGPSPARHRASSVVGGGSSNSAAKQQSRRVSQRTASSSVAGPHNPLQPDALAGLPAGKRGSKETVNTAGAASSSPSSSEASVAAAVKLLREGLARSLGCPLPSSSLFADGKLQGGKSEGCSSTNAQLKGLADTVLSRRSYSPTPAHQGATLFVELEGEEGRQDLVLEWIEDVLIFALRLGFNAPQTQCLLLDSMLALQTLEDEGADNDADDDDAAWEQRVSAALEDVLCTQTCPTTTRVIDTMWQRQPVVREVPDPVQLAELEQKRLKATTQKALAALDAAQASIPLVPRTFMEDVSVEVERDATLPPVFSMAEAAAVVDFVTRSVATHRRLWRLLLTATLPSLRPVVERPLCAYVEDVPPVFLPPLSSFYPARLQDEVDAQRAVYAECAAEKASLYAALYETPLAALSMEAAATRQALMSAAQRAAADDRDVALTTQECAHVAKAFQLRLQDTVQHNTHVVRADTTASSSVLAGSHKDESSGGDAAASLANALSAAAPEPAKHKAKKDSGGTAAVHAAKNPISASNLMRQSMLSADAAAAIPLPTSAVFTLAEVEQRVDRIAVVAEHLPSVGASGVAGRGGQRKH